MQKQECIFSKYLVNIDYTQTSSNWNNFYFHISFSGKLKEAQKQIEKYKGMILIQQFASMYFFNIVC